MKVSAAVAEILKREGVDTLFAYPRNAVIEEAAKAGRNLAIGGVLAIGATGVFLAALVTGLAALLVNMGMGEAAANFVAALLVTAVIGGVAWAMIYRGLAELKANKLNMQRTAHSIRMDADTVRESF